VFHVRPTLNALPSYSALLVEAARRAGGDELVHCAVRLANRFGADLLGLTTPAMIQRGEPVQRIDGLDDPVRATVQAVGSQFSKWSEPVNAKVNWCASRLPTEDALAVEAHAVDLIVAARTVDSHARRSAALASAIQTTGRPFLVVPNGCEQFQANSVIVCWNDSKECRRAVSDAMPFLVRASKVVVLAICYEPKPARMMARLDEIAASLQQRGIPAIARLSRQAKPTVSAAVNEVAQEHEADLIVAGAYGHSALYRAAIASTTDDLLNHSDHALLLSR
jgi:nucleotide-binding universal stress UspA family protein